MNLQQKVQINVLFLSLILELYLWQSKGSVRTPEFSLYGLENKLVCLRDVWKCEKLHESKVVKNYLTLDREKRLSNTC